MEPLLSERYSDEDMKLIVLAVGEDTVHVSAMEPTRVKENLRLWRHRGHVRYPVAAVECNPDWFVEVTGLGKLPVDLDLAEAARRFRFMRMDGRALTRPDSKQVWLWRRWEAALAEVDAA